MAIQDTRRANLRWLIENEFDGINVRLASKVGLDPSQISRALKLGMGDRLARRVESNTGKPAGWMDEVHLFSTARAQDLGPLRGKAVVVSPFGHRMVPVVTYDEAAEWIIAKRAYPVTERTEVDWIRMKRGGERVIGVIVEREDMMDEVWPGDVVFVDPELEPQPGDYVLAKLAGEKAPVFRKYRPRKRDSAGVRVIELTPLNEDHPELVIDGKHKGRILGVMVEHRKYRRRSAVGLTSPESKKKGGEA